VRGTIRYKFFLFAMSIALPHDVGKDFLLTALATLAVEIAMGMCWHPMTWTRGADKQTETLFSFEVVSVDPLAFCSFKRNSLEDLGLEWMFGAGVVLQRFLRSKLAVTIIASIEIVIRMFRWIERCAAVFAIIRMFRCGVLFQRFVWSKFFVTILAVVGMYQRDMAFEGSTRWKSIFTIITNMRMFRCHVLTEGLSRLELFLTWATNKWMGLRNMLSKIITGLEYVVTIITLKCMFGHFMLCKFFFRAEFAVTIITTMSLLIRNLNKLWMFGMVVGMEPTETVFHKLDNWT
jgi:hypothetical protein